MKILVTGGAGFIGSNLAGAFLANGDEVKVIDNLSTGSLDNLAFAQGNGDFELTTGSVTDKDTMRSLYSWCDQCYHLAAPVGVKYIMQRPVLTILDNIRGIDVVMELANEYKKKTFVASTSEIYGKSLDLLDGSSERKLKEDDYRIEGSTQNHRWAYANTKALDEFLALAYYKEFGSPVVIGRLFNTVGPKQISNYGMVIPNFVECALRGEDLHVYGTGQQRRSFMHVKDVVTAIRSLMSNEFATGEVFNVGNPVEITIHELALLIIRKTNSKSGIRLVSYEEAYGPGFEDMNRRTADISKLTSLTGFKIGYDLEAILDDIIACQEAKVRG